MAKKRMLYHGILLGMLKYRADWGVKSNQESGACYKKHCRAIVEKEVYAL